jgi:type I restriction enzyme S subunit
MLFYKETEFQDTPIGQAPKDWQVLKLGDDDVCEDIFYGITAKATEQNTGLRMLRTTDIKNYTADWGKLPFCEVTENRSALDKYIIKRGDIIIARAGTVGVSVLVNRDFTDVIFGSYLIKVRLKSSIIPEFAHYFLQSNLYWKHIQKAQGSTLKNINLPILKELSLPIPSLEEQRAIVAVLGVVDSVIAKTDEVIAKTERLKKGLMQTLLTRGIGHKEYKQTPIGTIPKNWELVRINELGELQYGYTTSAVQENTGTKFLRITDIQEDGSVNWEEVPYCHIEEDEFSKYALQKGDLLFARIGATAGKTTYINHNVSGIFASYLIRLKTTKENVYPHFLFYFTQSPAYWSQAIRQREGQLKKGINATMLSNFIVPLPSFEEQQKIAEILSVIDRKLKLERIEKGKLEKIKRGLMDLLLTGKVRVKVD